MSWLTFSLAIGFLGGLLFAYPLLGVLVILILIGVIRECGNEPE